MKRDAYTQFKKDPDNNAKLFLALTGAMIITTFLIVIGTIILILNLVGIL